MKRQVGNRSGRGQGSLPLTEADRSDEAGKHRRKRRPLSPVKAVSALLVTIVSVGMLVAMAQRFFWGPPVLGIVEEPPRKLVAKERDLPLQDFPSLQYALRNSEVTLLYFAAVSSQRGRTDKVK